MTEAPTLVPCPWCWAGVPQTNEAPGCGWCDDTGSVPAGTMGRAPRFYGAGEVVAVIDPARLRLWRHLYDLPRPQLCTIQTSGNRGLPAFGQTFIAMEAYPGLEPGDPVSVSQHPPLIERSTPANAHRFIGTFERYGIDQAPAEVTSQPHANTADVTEQPAPEQRGRAFWIELEPRP